MPLPLISWGQQLHSLPSLSLSAEMSTQSGRHKKTYISYRDSVLTWLLKDSLGGNSKTIMIASVFSWFVDLVFEFELLCDVGICLLL